MSVRSNKGRRILRAAKREIAETLAIRAKDLLSRGGGIEEVNSLIVPRPEVVAAHYVKTGQWRI